MDLRFRAAAPKGRGAVAGSEGVPDGGGQGLAEGALGALSCPADGGWRGRETAGAAGGVASLSQMSNEQRQPSTQQPGHIAHAFTLV